MSFLPSAPQPSAQVAALADPPAVEPNLYLNAMPLSLVVNPQPPARRTRADDLVQRADHSFQQGRKYYQSNDIPKARREFDNAVDLMLEALGQTGGSEYERRLDEMVDAIHQLDLAGMGAAAGVEEDKFEKAPLEDILQMTFPVDPRLKDKVREQVAATRSQLPLSVNDTVLGYIHYFSNRGRKTLLAGLQRSGRYRAMVQRILDEEGVPLELIHLAQAESGFMARAVSRKAAGGMWQFLTWRGNEYGLQQTRYSDDRMDPEKATRAAARHLRDLYHKFGDWYLAIAAYNCGPGVVEKAVERTGYADFWELRGRGVLPAETTNYVPIILAMTIMEKNAAEYGIAGIALDPPLEYDSVEVSTRTSLALISDLADMPLAQLAALNPAVLKGMVPENYPLHVPKGAGNQLTAALALIPAEHRTSWRMHRVATGETLAGIGKRYGAGINSIMAANNLRSPQAVEGDRLIIPAVARAEAPARRTVARSVVARRRAPAGRVTKAAAYKSRTARTPRKAPIVLTHTASR